MEATKEAFAETEAQAKNTSPDLVLLLRDYLNLRKAERSDWSRYGQQKGTTDDLKAVSKAIIYLKEHELFTLEDLDAALQGMSEKSKGINAAMKAAATESFGYNEDEIVSSDIIGMRFGSLFDATQTMVCALPDGKTQVQVVSWYDNENSYVSQMCRTIKYFAKFL